MKFKEILPALFGIAILALCLAILAGANQSAYDKYQREKKDCAEGRHRYGCWESSPGNPGKQSRTCIHCNWRQDASVIKEEDK
jgi:hypothetical protein